MGQVEVNKETYEIVVTVDYQEKGDKGDKGDPGPVQDLTPYAKLEQLPLDNNYVVQGNELWKPSTANELRYDMSKIVLSARLSITSDFRKSDGSIRKMYVYSLTYNIGTDTLTGRLNVEQADGSYLLTSSISSVGSKIVAIPFTEGELSIEFDTSKLIYSINVPATYAQAGISPNLIEAGVVAYEMSSVSDAFKDFEISLKTEISKSISIGYLNANGESLPSSNWRVTTDFISVKPGEMIWIEANTVPGAVAHAMWGYLDGIAIQSIAFGISYVEGGIRYTMPEGINQIKACSYIDTTLTLYRIGSGSASIGKLNMNKAWNAVGMSIWASDEITYDGYQTLIKRMYSFTTYNKYCYSGNSLGGTSVSDPASILTKTGWTGGDDDIWTLDSNTNDFKRDIPIGTIADYNNNTGITTFYGALRVFKDKVLALSPNATVITSNALRRNNGGYTSTSANAVGATLADYEVASMTIAELNGWLFVDQFRMSGITDETLSITTSDGLHLNNFGYTLAVLPWLPYFEIIYKNQFNN